MNGGALIPDKSRNRIHLMYLNLLHDLNNIKKYSWLFTYSKIYIFNFNGAYYNIIMNTGFVCFTFQMEWW